MPRLKLFSDMPDRGLFIAFVALGFILIFGAKTALWYLGYEGDYSIPIAAGAAATMFVYGFLAYRVPEVRLRPDRLGDNFYYMGFVFTLASMSAALVQLQSGREIDALIGSFGIALFSTILGIAGRVAFVQMRTEVEDIEERVRQNLLDAAATLRGQLGAAVRDLETFRLGVQQAIHERLTESASAFGQMAEAQVSRIGKTVEETISSVQSAFAAHERSAESLATLGTKVSASIDNLVAQIEAIHVPPSLLEDKIDAMLAKLAETAAAFERVAETDKERHASLAKAAAELRRVVTQIGNELRKLQATAQDLQSSTSPAAEMDKSLAQMRGTLDATSAAAQTLTESITAYRAMIESVTKVQEATAADAEGTRRRMVQDLEESRAAVVAVQKTLAETARVVTQAINAPPLA